MGKLETLISILDALSTDPDTEVVIMYRKAGRLSHVARARGIVDALSASAVEIYDLGTDTEVVIPLDKITQLIVKV